MLPDNYLALSPLLSVHLWV